MRRPIKLQSELTISGLQKEIAALKEKGEELDDLRDQLDVWKSKFYNYTEIKKIETTETNQRMEKMEQESKMNNLCIVDIPEEDHGNLQTKVLSIAKRS